jgi:fermentation-respiration switch protein FrsA (DUF1100 family)
MIHFKQLKYIQRFSSMFIELIIIFTVIYLVLVFIIYLFQSHLVYFPDKHIIYNPKAMLNLEYDDIYFETGDRVKLNGWYIPAKDEHGVILFCHGNAGNISHRLESINIFNQLNMSVFIFDYRGYGMSEGKPGEKGIYLDAEAAWNYLCDFREIRPEKLIIFGRSLGAAIAAWLAKEKSPAAVILESSFTSIPELGTKIYPFLPVRLISRFHYSTAKHVQDIHCKKLFIHSKEDEIIPFSLGEKNYLQAAKPKQFLMIYGSHNDGFMQSFQIYTEKLKSFFDEVLNQ